MNNNRLFEHVLGNSKQLGIKFSDFKLMLERNDFSDLDKKNQKLKTMPLNGDESLLYALNIDVDDADVLQEISSVIPAFSSLFLGEQSNRVKAIDLFNAQIEAVKKLITNFESTFTASISGKEDTEQYTPSIPGIDEITGNVNLTNKVINKAAAVFTTSIVGSDGSSSVDAFVSGDAGKGLVKLLNGLRVDTDVVKFIDTTFNPLVNKLQSQNIDFVVTSLDQTKMPEINSENIDTTIINDYLSGRSDMSELEMADSMDPFVRLGLFYQLCLVQQPEFISKITSDIRGTKLSYPDFTTDGKSFEQSLRTLFGRDIDLTALDPYMPQLNELSTVLINSSWNAPAAEDIKKMLFIPAMQVFYVSLMNFVLAKALYKFLTKRTEIIVKAKQEQEEELKRVQAEQEKSRILIPSMMDDKARGNKIKEIFKNPALQALLKDNTIYIPGRAGYDPERVKALKELVYYAFGGKDTVPGEGPSIPSVVNWDITKNPLDGNYDQFFSNIIRDIQTKFSIRPIRAGKGDGKVGPNTKQFFAMNIPNAIVELI